MKKILLQISIWMGLAVATPLAAQTTAAITPLLTGQSTETTLVIPADDAQAHPFFLHGLYPEWSKLTAEQAYVDARAAMELCKERVARICELSEEEANFENTFLAAENSTLELQNVLYALQHLSQVNDTPEFRAAVEQLSADFMDMQAVIFTNDRLWQLMKAASRPERMEGLSPAKKRAVQQICEIFIDNGIELSPEGKKRKTELEKEILKLCLQYDKNIQDYTQSWELLITDSELLAGVPAPVMSAMRRAAQEAGHCKDGKAAWLVTMRDGTVGTVMTYCDVQATRKQCWEGLRGVCSAAPYDNEPLVMRIMELRQELAELLRFRHFADYEARTRMVDTGRDALEFVNFMIEKIKPTYEAEMQQMMEYYRRYVDSEATALPPWDELYAAIIYFSLQSDTASVDITPYLSAGNVMNGMLAHYSKLLGLTFRQLPSAYVKPGETCPEGKIEVWHPSVKVVGIYDTATGTHYGSFYMDLYRRETKRPGGWCSPIRLANPGPNGEILEPHIGVLVTNFDPPRKGKPTLFSFADVQVLFHEFGHMLHHMLSHTEMQGHCAIGVAWDFSEFPSTLSENFAWEPAVLSTFAFHYKTGEPYPAEQLEKLAAQRNFLVADKYMELLRQARLDLELHMNFNEKFRGRDLDEVSAELTAGLTPPFTMPNFSEMRYVPHCISGGYTAGLYTYAWSEVMAADAYTRFRQEGITNPEVGAAYRKSILELGDSKPAMELYRMFMGRTPSAEPFLKARGFIK